MRTRGTCLAKGCQNPTRSVWSVHCERCRQRNRRHGDPKQKAVRKQDLRPYLSRARHLLRNKAKANEATTLIYANLREVALSLAGEEGRGGLPQHMARAGREIATVLADVTPSDCAQTVGAMFLSQFRHGLYTNHRAFLFQLTRQFRKLSPQGIGSYWDDNAKRARTVYRDLPYRVSEQIGTLLVEAYKTFGVYLTKAHEKESLRSARIRSLLAD